MIKRLSGLFLLLSICSATATAQFLYDYTTIQRIEIIFDQPNWDYQMDTAKIGTDTFIVASTVLINGIQFDSVGVKYKGNSSYDSTYAKNPLHLSLDEFKNQSYDGYTSIKLGNGYADPSMIREVISYNVLRNYMDCPQSSFAEVFINGVYIGLYSNIESVDKKFISAKFLSSQNAFFKCNPIGNPGPTTKCNLKFINADSSSYQNYYELKSDYGWNELVNLCDTVTNTPAALSSIIDIDRVAWMLAFNNVMVNLDSYSGVFCQNYYLYRDNDGLFNPVVWDLNMSLGGFPFAGGGATGMGSLNVTAMTQFPLNAHSTDPYWPLINDIFNNAQFKRMYFAHARTITNEFLSTLGYSVMANYLQGIINPSVTADTNKFFSDTQYQNSLTTDISIGSYTVPGINNLCSARNSFLLASTEFNYTLPDINNILVSDTFPKIDSTIYITAAISNAGLGVYLGYRYDNDLHFTRIPMFDDGAHGDGSAGDGVYGVSVTMDAAQLYYYIYAENTDAGMFSPERAEHEFYHVTANVPVATAGQVVINEFLAVNQSDTINENGKNEDWIEFYNTTNSDLSLFGLYITDDFTNPTKFAFPENTIIQANSYLIIWADEKNTTSSYIHTNFKLAGTGEELMLSDLNGNVLDSLTFGPQANDLSWGRCPNGTGNFQVLPSTTFAKENCPVGIDEISIYNGTIEIYPNPAHSQMTIRFSEFAKSFTICDITGRVMLSASGGQEVKLDISNVPAGVYFVRAGSSTKRFIIN
ncbi:MAG: CotH kinase family protein [Bacteroidetes bacterium]|nr:CotH kinase family protein [Bacteroidota bacterium]